MGNRDFKIIKLPNGMEILFIKRFEKYTVGITLILNAGSIYEDKKDSGISHFFEHLLFTGTKSYPKEEMIKERFQELGASISARTFHDRIEFLGTSPNSETKKTLDLLKEMVYMSNLSKPSIEKERGVILQEERLARDQEDTILWLLAYKHRFKKGNPIRLPIIGTETTIKNIKEKSIRSYYLKHCTASNSKLVIAGDFEVYEMKEIARVFSDLPKTLAYKQPRLKNQYSTFVSKQKFTDSNQVYLLITFPCYFGTNLKLAWQDGFLSQLLQDRLYNSLFIEQGLVYLVGCSLYDLTSDVSVLYIQTACQPSNFDRVRKTILEEIQKIRKGNIDFKTFERLRTVGNKTYPMNFDSLEGAINWCKISFYREDKIYSIKEVIEARNGIKKIDLIKRAKKLFEKNQMNIISLGSK